LVARLQEKLNLSKEDAELLFQDTMRFLYLVTVNTPADPLYPPKMVDEGWHHFLMFTQDYQKFCQDFFGRFIHHRPRYIEDLADPDHVEAKARAAHTITLARQVFGELSEFWTTASGDCLATCGNCGGV
jgi:hypothetical protein